MTEQIPGHSEIKLGLYASISRLTGYEPGVLPSARRDTTASSGMLTGHQDPLWMFARLRGSTASSTIFES
jgi:hypothetical protein